MKKILQLFVMIAMIGQAQAQITFESTNPFVENAMYGSCDWIIIDSTTNERVALITGQNINDIISDSSAKLYSQDGTELFDFNIIAYWSTVAYFYENDYIYIAILTEYEGMKIFRALLDGNLNFIEIYANATNYIYATLTNIDINDDGFEDFIFSGVKQGASVLENRVLQNNGDGTFTLVAAPSSIPPASNDGHYKSAILDDSGRKHLVVTVDGGGSILENNGAGVFTEVLALERTTRNPYITIADIDNDGLNDISVSSLRVGVTIGTTIYKNLGNLTFQVYDSYYTELHNIDNGTIEYGDFNNDGLLDAVIAGPFKTEEGSWSVVNAIFLQTTDFKFDGGRINLVAQDQWNQPYMLALFHSSMDLYDYNNDGKLDILITGNQGGGPGPFASPQTWLMTNTSVLSVEDFEHEGFTMYPNPARDIVSFKGIENIKSIDVYNQLGQQVLSIKATNSINIESLAAGMYVVNVSLESGSIGTKKLIKKD